MENKIKFNRLEGAERWQPSPTSPTQIKICGNIIEVRASALPFKPPPVERISGDEYIDLNTGEVKEYNRDGLNFGDNVQSARRATRNFRDLINCNCVNPKNFWFVTLTYAQRNDPLEKCVPMTDINRFYEDYRRYWEKFKYYNQHTLGRELPIYFLALEPHRPKPDGSHGGWHAHQIIYWRDGPAPRWDQVALGAMWGQGYVFIQTGTSSQKTGRPSSDIDNLGAYLSSYVTGFVGDPDGHGKRAEKHRRLEYYSKGMRPFRHSRNIAKPVFIKDITYEEVQEVLKKNNVDISGKVPTYIESFVMLSCDDSVGSVCAPSSPVGPSAKGSDENKINIFTTTYYNLLR